MIAKLTLASMALTATMFFTVVPKDDYKIDTKVIEDNSVLDILNKFSLMDKIKDEVEKREVEGNIEKLGTYRQLGSLEKRQKRKSISRGKEVPNNKDSPKTYMDYRAITSKASEQYKLQQSEDVYTDENGYRRLGDKFMVALGSYYGQVGTELTIGLDNGSEFEVILSDIKANIHTDDKNQKHLVDKSVLEFIVDQKKLEEIVRKMGDCSYSKSNNFNGSIVSINEIANN